MRIKAWISIQWQLLRLMVDVYKRQVVEALNESLGVVYRDVASTGKIVVIGRP